jgi:pimeloyl-ACP methyl ester carboxylesterase
MNRSFRFENIKVTYSDTGKGHTIILLHGYLITKEVWQPVGEIISREFRVLAVDLPGHGGSGVAGEIHTMEFLAEAARAAINDAGAERVLLAGHSMGGYAALAFAEKYPEMLSGYVLFHSHPWADAPETVEKRKREIDIVRAGKKDIMYPQNISMMFAERNLDPLAEQVEKLKSYAARNPAEGIIAMLYGMIARPCRVSVVENGRRPLLWVLGRHDRYFSPEKALRDIKLPDNGEVVILENSGHLGFIEETERSAELLTGFSASLDW